MAKAPDPQVQFRNIRIAWDRLNDDQRLVIAEELIGPLYASQAPAETAVEPSRAALDDETRLKDPYAQAKHLSNLFIEFARRIDLDIPGVEHVLNASDAVYTMSISLGKREGKLQSNVLARATGDAWCSYDKSMARPAMGSPSHSES